MRHRLAIPLLLAALVLSALPAGATPVAQNEEERDLYGRVFLEPVSSTNYIQFGEEGKGELEGGLKLLEKLYPRYLDVTTVADELGSPHAVSVGVDALPSWAPNDSGDGLPLHVAIVTDETVPDKNKEYVVLMASHSGEPCGREGAARLIEDLLLWADEDPDHVLDNAEGLTGKTYEFTAKEILQRTKIYYVSTSPDGWFAGDGQLAGHSQYNGAGINSNRVAFQDGWVFPPEPELYTKGYTVLTQPEGAAITKYLIGIREKELKGKPFAVGMDVHGPVPAGFILLHDQGNDPQKLERVKDLGFRIKQNMEEVIAGSDLADSAIEDNVYVVRDNAPDNREIGTRDNYAWQMSGVARWAFVTHINDSLAYTASSTWGGWMNSDSGLDSDSLSYEINCRASTPWAGADMQFFVDNVRAVFETGIVSAAARAKMPEFQIKLKGDIGFYDSGVRVTKRDGNPSPPPRGYPSTPLIDQVKQAPYDVSNTDYFRDLPMVTKKRLREVGPGDLGALDKLDTFVVSDSQAPGTAAVVNFVKSGGNLVLTDSALKMLPGLLNVPKNSLSKGYGYVGYANLDRSHALTEGLLATASQTFDPTAIGYPLLMERDGYWTSNGGEGGSDDSGTLNSAPIWTIDRDTWEGAGGVTVGTSDPPADRKTVADGTAQDKTSIGVVEVGKGRIVIFGSLLPLPSEDYPHWFGLNAYGISVAGQTMLLRALNGEG